MFLSFWGLEVREVVIKAWSADLHWPAMDENRNVLFI
jgi:hypothetical protein